MRLVISNFLIWITVSFVPMHAAIPSEMAKLISTDVQACDNFYQYACGKWLKSKENSAVKVEYSMKKIEEKRLELLDKVKRYPVLKEFWNSCTSVGKRGLFSMKSSIDRGNAPLMEDLEKISRVVQNRDILKLAGSFYRTGTNGFIDLTIQPDEQRDNYALYLRPAKLTLPDHSYQKIGDPITKDPFYQYIEELISLSFTGQSRLMNALNLNQAGKIVIEMETKIWQLKKETKGNIKPIVVRNVAQRWPNTVGAFLKGSLPIRFSEQKIYTEYSNYFDKLEELIKMAKESHLKPYLAFQMIHSRSQWLGEDFRHLWDQKMVGKPTVIDRKTFCQERLVDLLPELVEKYFSDKGLDQTRELQAKIMATLVRKAIGRRILQSTWMSEGDVEQAIKKLSNLLIFIGKPVDGSITSNLLTRDNYYANVYFILLKRFKTEMKTVGSKVQWVKWRSSALAEAKYDPQMNSVLFSSAMLQSPLFDGVSVHPARDFGAMGTIMGHEITHGYDKIGSEYGTLGQKKEWWSDTTKHQFDNQVAMCMVNRYSSFEGGKVDAVATLSQNIADTGGLALAWHAYKQYMDDHSTEKLPGTKGMKATDGDKLFFLAFAQSLCTHIPRDDSTDPKSTPPELRVNGALMNHKYFNIVYGCNANHKMYTEERCAIW